LTPPGIFKVLDKDQRPVYSDAKTITRTFDQIVGKTYSSTEVKLKQNWKQFNELIGLPKHPATLIPMPLMEWQNQWKETIDRVRKRWHKFHANKSRQIGFTDIMQRIFAYGGFNVYQGRKIFNIAGTREKTAKKNQTKLRSLFNNIENQIADNGTDLWFKLKNGTEYEALPANGAIRGDTKIAAVGLDEAAHFKLVDDSVVMDAIVPIVDTNMSDLFLWSTPNGKRGSFYNIDITQNDYFKVKLPIFVAQGFLYTPAQIKAILSRKEVDVEQEYLNQYTTSRDSIFGDDFDEDPGIIPEDYSKI